MNKEKQSWKRETHLVFNNHLHTQYQQLTI
nr:MAG TPA: hypothetical protein [Caudoviricetes sp.]DAS80618.1 MAG TPA: hypothetical protein [Caudoviricetes sp.]DAT52310.1 MAG TPA: hypothetical protein [Caudoviricetes sp.]DAX90588.1 MAG TPA: hypothetical protein [Caudoviricetes sp.]